MATIAELKKNFKWLADNHRISHSYLLFGLNRGFQKKSDAKLDLVKELANYLENGQWKATTNLLMDTLILSGGGIGEIRQAISFLWQKPVKSDKKTLIIPDASLLTHEAQNAILKVSEEPPGHALILL